MAADNTKKAPTDIGPSGTHDDVESDPAEGAEDRTDWSGEGGATPSGPAKDEDAASE